MVRGIICSKVANCTVIAVIALPAAPRALLRREVLLPASVSVASHLLLLTLIFISALWRSGCAFQFVEALCVCDLKLPSTLRGN